MSQKRTPSGHAKVRPGKDAKVRMAEPEQEKGPRSRPLGEVDVVYSAAAAREKLLQERDGRWGEHDADIRDRSGRLQEVIDGCESEIAELEQTLERLLQDVHNLSKGEERPPTPPPVPVKKNSRNKEKVPEPPKVTEEERLAKEAEQKKILDQLMNIYRKKPKPQRPKPPPREPVEGEEVPEDTVSLSGVGVVAGSTREDEPVDKPVEKKKGALEPQMIQQVLVLQESRHNAETQLAAVQAKLDVLLERQENLNKLQSIGTYSLASVKKNLETHKPIFAEAEKKKEEADHAWAVENGEEKPNDKKRAGGRKR